MLIVPKETSYPSYSLWQFDIALMKTYLINWLNTEYPLFFFFCNWLAQQEVECPKYYSIWFTRQKILSILKAYIAFLGMPLKINQKPLDKVRNFVMLTQEISENSFTLIGLMCQHNEDIPQDDRSNTEMSLGKRQASSKHLFQLILVSNLSSAWLSFPIHFEYCHHNLQKQISLMKINSQGWITMLLCLSLWKSHQISF